MATAPRCPSLLQINTGVWLERLSREAGDRLGGPAGDRVMARVLDLFVRQPAEARHRQALMGIRSCRRGRSHGCAVSTIISPRQESNTRQ
jgi:hypothetical protein